MQPGPHYRITLLNRSSVTRCELPIQAAGLVAGVSRENRTGISPLATEFIFALAISRPVPGTGLQSPETGRQNRRCRDLNWRQRPHVPHLNPRKCPQIAGYSSETGKHWFASDCVVVDAARIEPVSTSNSLLAGNLAGNFSKKGPPRAILAFKTITANSLLNGAGNFFAGAGNFL